MQPTYDKNSIVDTLKSQGKASDFASRSKLAAEKGITGYTGTAAQNTQLLGLIKQPTPTVTPSVQTSDAATLAAKAATDKLASVTTAQKGKTVVSTITNGDGSTTTTYADGTSTTTGPTTGTKTKSALEGVLGKDKAGAIDSKVAELDASLSETKKSIDAMLANMSADIDTETASLVENIKNIYAGRIDDQKKINAAMIGSTNVSGLVSGRTRYASTIQDSILSAEESAGLKRINDLSNEMMNLVSTAKSAAKDKKSEMVFKTMDQYDKAKKAHDDAVQNQYKMAMDLEKLAIDQSQEARQQIKDELSNMESTAKNLVTGIVDLPEKEILTSIKELSASYGVDENYLMAAVNNLKQDRLKGAGSDINGWEYMKQNYGYTGTLFQFQEAQRAASKVANNINSGNLSAGNVFTREEADALGISQSGLALLGKTDTQVMNDLLSDEPPEWFIQMVKEQEPDKKFKDRGWQSTWINYKSLPQIQQYINMVRGAVNKPTGSTGPNIGKN
jgi:hypothetical protein